MDPELAKSLAIDCAHYLYEGGEQEALSLLVSCGINFSMETSQNDWHTFYIYCSRTAYDALKAERSSLRQTIANALLVASENHLNGNVVHIEPRFMVERDTRWVEGLKKALPNVDAVDAQFRE